MTENVLQQYYQGITLRLRSEVDLINSLIGHKGVKGEGNEDLLRSLLQQFIPDRFGVGTGIVVDRHGKASRQCDIVVYDRFLFPSLLSLGAVSLYPVDIVYAVVEVKTRLDSKSAKEALNNVSSVRSLDFVRDHFIARRGSGVNIVAPTAPIGCVFAFNSTVKRFETYSGWFQPSAEHTADKMPALVGCLDQGVIRYSRLDPRRGDEPMEIALPLCDAEGKVPKVVDQEDLVEIGGILYPIKEVAGDRLPVDQSKVLLVFLLLLSDCLNQKPLNSELKFTDHYLSGALSRLKIVKEGKMT